MAPAFDFVLVLVHTVGLQIAHCGGISCRKGSWLAHGWLAGMQPSERSGHGPKTWWLQALVAGESICRCWC